MSQLRDISSVGAGKLHLESSLKEPNEKTAAYLAAGAIEAWIVFPQSNGNVGPLQTSRYAVDLAELFD